MNVGADAFELCSTPAPPPPLLREVVVGVTALVFAELIAADVGLVVARTEELAWVRREGSTGAFVVKSSGRVMPCREAQVLGSRPFGQHLPLMRQKELRGQPPVVGSVSIVIRGAKL